MPKAAVIDYMHQVLLGVVKTFLIILHMKKLSQRKSKFVSNWLKSIVFPTGFELKVRTLDLIKYWRASELSNFALYGLTTLNDVRHENLIAHFWLLSLAITLLAEYSAPIVICEARSFIGKYRKKLTSIFKDSVEVYNMHSLSHMTDRVKTNGPLVRFLQGELKVQTIT